jgi:hypothetical protein
MEDQKLNATSATLPEIAAVDELGSGERTIQQDITPASTQRRFLGEVITGYPESTDIGSGAYSSTVTVADGGSRTFTFTLTDLYNRVKMASPDQSFYIDGSSWPNSTHNMTNVICTFWNDWSQTDNVDTATRMSLVNNSGVSISVIAVVRFRFILNAKSTNSLGVVEV